MKFILVSLFSIALGSSAAFFIFQTPKEESPAIAEIGQMPEESPQILVYSPSTFQAIKPVKVPDVQTSLLNDTQLENDLLYSLAQDKLVTESSRVESVNCIDKRCQILVEPLTEAAQPAFVQHLEEHPEFGRNLRISMNGDKENKKLLTLLYSQENQVTTTH